MKTLDIQAKEWRDKVNGNSYFSARVTVDYCMETERTFFLPFQYGYGSQYEWEALAELARNGIIPNERHSNGMPSYSLYSLRESGVIIRSHIEKNSKKRDVRAWGQE